MSKKRKAAIGKGLGALLSNFEEETKVNPEEVVATLSSNIAELPIKSIEVNPFQPRTEFNAETLAELSNSIQIHGLIQPITVRRLSNDTYQLISGERRWRASQKAGLTKIPAYIRIAANDQEMLEMALVENIQRQELNAIEIAITYQRLMDECKLTHESLADRVGKNRSTVTNYLRLLRLPPEIQVAIKEAKISMGHARCLVGIEDIGLQLSIFKETIERQLSVRALEQLIKQQNAGKKTAKKAAQLPHEYRDVQNRLVNQLGTKVDLKVGNKGQGEINIKFASTEELNRILDLIDK